MIVTKNRQSGFTLIELVVTVGLLSLLMITVSAMFMTTLNSNLRTQVRQQIKDEGAFILERFEFMLRNASTLSASQTCEANLSQISFVNPDGNQTTFSLDNNRIASVSAVTGGNSTTYPLHNASTVASGLNFDCGRNPSGEYYVDISFNLENSDTQIEESFQHLVLMRNF